MIPWTKFCQLRERFELVYDHNKSENMKTRKNPQIIVNNF